MLDGLSAIVGGVAVYVANIFSERWKSDAATHSEKLKGEFEYRRKRLEELHSLAGTTSTNICEHALAWQARLDIAGAKLTENFPAPGVVEIPSEQISLLVEFYFPELQQARRDYWAAWIEYMKLQVEVMRPGAKTGKPLVEQSMQVHQQCLLFQKAITELHALELRKYLEPPIGMNDLGHRMGSLAAKWRPAKHG